MGVMRGALVVLVVLLPAAARAEMRLPAGFTAEVYVTGRGEAPDGRGPAIGIPSMTSVAFDAAGALYATRTGRRYRGGVLDARWLVLNRPRLVAARGERVWVAADGETEAPWMNGAGELWTIRGDERRVALRGPIVAGMDVGPGGRLFVADRHNARILAVAADGASTEVATFTDGDAPRTLAWAPVTEATRRAGIAGALFVLVTRRGTWSLNEVVRVSGPFDELIRTGLSAR